jgi:hypothetical protein
MTWAEKRNFLKPQSAYCALEHTNSIKLPRMRHSFHVSTSPMSGYSYSAYPAKARKAVCTETTLDGPGQ